MMSEDTVSSIPSSLILDVKLNYVQNTHIRVRTASLVNFKSSLACQLMLLSRTCKLTYEG